MGDQSRHKFAYRPDIDGLRAIAVLAVVIFHLGFERFEGGFLGVDIFFVISGFLITAIIYPQITQSRFSFKRFYLRRVRRLLPPAFAAILVTFIASALTLTPIDFIAFAESAIAALFSVSNIYFFTEAGYWDGASEFKPLLHTWSLGVEEQFYLFWPLLIWGAARSLLSRNPMTAFIALTLIGVVLSEYMLRVNPSAAFYLLPARFFEFTAGASFFFLSKTGLWSRMGSKRLLREALSLIGLIVLAVIILEYDGTTPFPGVMGLWPCMATGLILLAGARPRGDVHESTIQSACLSNPVMVWIGRLSYSLYLAHWPVVSLMRYEVGVELRPREQLFALILTIGLTIILYYGVERRLSARSGMGQSDARPALNLGQFALTMLAASATLATVSAHAVWKDGWEWRFPTVHITADAIKAGMRDRFENLSQQCPVADYPTGRACKSDADIQILTFGNSHEVDGFNFLNAAYGQREDVNLIGFGTINACHIKPSKDGAFESQEPHCRARVERLMDPAFVRDLDLIFYSSRTPFAANKGLMRDMFTHLKTLNPAVKIVSFGGFLNTQSDCPKLINQSGDDDACFATENIRHFPSLERQEPLEEAFRKLSDAVIDQVALLCPDATADSCIKRAEDGSPFSYDDHHLSRPYAEMAGRRFARENPDFLEQVLAPPPRD